MATQSSLLDDHVFYSIYPDSSLSTSSLQSLHLQILHHLSPFVSDYIWQHQPFFLSLSDAPVPHLYGRLRFGDNLEDEWFTVFLIFEISRAFPNLSIRVWDSDGEFLLMEAAFHLPRWLNPENSENRLFIRRGDIHIIPKKSLPNPSLADSLNFLINHEKESRAAEAVQNAIKSKISEYPERAKRNMHIVRVRVPVSVAQVLKHEPCLISLAVEGFYDRDIDSMKYAATMERFLTKGREEELVLVNVKMSRAMYAQLMQQTFQAPKCYPMPARGGDVTGYLEAELGMKIACGFEMVYWMRKKEGDEGKGSTWSKYKESLEESGYFEGLIPGSKEYKRLMENAEEYYRKSNLFVRASKMMSAPVRRIDEILALPHSAEDFKGQDVHPSDDDSWLYNGEDELNSALQERQKELELYNSELRDKKKSKESQDTGSSSGKNLDDFDLGGLAKTMQAFVHKVSSYKGAEVPENRNLEEVNIDVDCFIKDLESVVRHQASELTTNNADSDEGSSSDMDFDESQDGSDMADEDNDGAEDSFMHSYSDAMNNELKKTTLKKSFIHANEESSKKIEGTSNEAEDMEEEFTPVDVDVNLVKNLLDSFSSQQGLPGPASNLLGLMGVKLPQDDNRGK
ncbi:protein ecdysoneless homolog [Mangifera indica]|uniref:protein ecdysoneless homolog n=1 Tax=Mangifera indica TaxID=29780 RepID=UPI001CF9A117|nr:protein ecdysoneless homolog [Mangifera indica]